MRPPPTCPRCECVVRAPDLWSSDWRCEQHGAVHPFHVAARPQPAVLDQLVRQSAVPIWVPDPLLPGWTVTGIGHAGDERTGARATAIAFTGPSPAGGPADLVIVAEEPAVGLGARFAGLASVDPGPPPDTVPDAKVLAAGHPTPLWYTPTQDDRVTFVGEAKGLWLWAVLWPPTASLLFLEDVILDDLREQPGRVRELVFGAPSPYLHPPAVPPPP